MWGDGSGRDAIVRDWSGRVPVAPSTGIEPVAYRLGGGRSIRLSYEGEGGALCGALLPITVFLAVKATGGVRLALRDRLSWG